MSQWLVIFGSYVYRICGCCALRRTIEKWECACVAQAMQVRNDSGGRGALAKVLGKFANSEEFVGVAHSAEQ